MNVEYYADDSSVLSASITELDDQGRSGDLSEVIDSLSDDRSFSLNDLLSRCQAERYLLHRAIINDDSRVRIKIYLPFYKISDKFSKLCRHQSPQLS